jgi:hypothetical protein
MGPAGFRVLWPDDGLEGTMNRWLVESGIPQRKLCVSYAAQTSWPRRARLATKLEVSPATLYNWRRSYGGMDPDAAKELKELLEQNSRLKRLWLRRSWRRTRYARWPRTLLPFS